MPLTPSLIRLLVSLVPFVPNCKSLFEPCLKTWPTLLASSLSSATSALTVAVKHWNKAVFGNSQQAPNLSPAKRFWWCDRGLLTFQKVSLLSVRFALRAELTFSYWCPEGELRPWLPISEDSFVCTFLSSSTYLKHWWRVGVERVIETSPSVPGQPLKNRSGPTSRRESRLSRWERSS